VEGPTGTSSIPDIEAFSEISGNAPAASPPMKRPAAATSAPKNDVSGPSPAPGFWSLQREQEYYTSAGRKVADFFIGLIGINIALWILFFPFSLLLGYLGSFSIYIVLFLLQLIIFVAILVCAFVFRRYWIGIGMITSVILGILFVLLIYLAFSNFY
jgi:hypothetical protein